MLYDIRAAQSFGGLSLWNNDVVNAKQTLEDHAVQNAEFTYSYSLDEARDHVALDVEGSLSLDIGIINATGPASYLNDQKSSTFEARANVSCTVVRRTRRLPLEILASREYERHLGDSRFTHFVAEVVEGGSATLSFVKSCSSSEDANNVLGELKLELVNLPVGGVASVELSQDSVFEGFEISYSGAIAENLSNIEDARRIALEMPTKLGQQLNALYYKLLPLAILDSTTDRNIRNIDENLVTKTAAVLKAGTMTQSKLKDLKEQYVFQNSFPAINQQILNIQTAFAKAETEFKQAARRLLPDLRDGTTNYSTKISELEVVLTLFEQRIRIAVQFIAKKCNEARVLGSTVASLLADGFENHLGGLAARSLTHNEKPALLLSFGGASISPSQHQLQKKIESPKISAVSDDESDSNDDDEWFENQQTVANLMDACKALRRQRSLALSAVTFGVACVNRAYRPGKEKRSQTSFGDIVLDYKGKLLIVTGMLLEAPTPPTLTVKGQTITVAWCHDRNDQERLAIPTTGFVVRVCPRPNPAKDGAFPRAMANEASEEIQCEASETTVVIDRANGAPLFDDCDYEVGLSVKTIIGFSDWSIPVVCRTLKLPSVASRMIDFYRNNCTILSRSRQGAKPWDLNESVSKKTLFLGFTVQADHVCTDSRFTGQLAVRIVDVAAEFEPDILAAPTQDRDKTIVAVFAGCSGHGKSTEINAFVSYLLGGDIDDSARIMVIDDRGDHGARSVTQYVTCYRIRPFSSLFHGKTLLIVDTPGYGDTRGIERDAFVTAAMSEFFKTIEHVNAIIFTCRSNEARTTLLSPVSAYVFSLFAKDVKSCLRTIYTFSDAGAPLARTALRELEWPVGNGEVEVNNAAFAVELDVTNDDKVRDWWLMSIKGQYQVMNMLLRRPAVPTAASASVTRDRLDLERKCELAEKKIFRTANDARNLIANLTALAHAVGAAPDEKILVENDKSVQETLPPGQATTLCLTCNQTCHEKCQIKDDGEKARCCAMTNGICDICKGRCHWSEHRNATYKIVIVKEQQWMVPDALIKRWNSNNNTLEGSLLSAIDAYLALQEDLRTDILTLAELTAKLVDTALLHDQTAIIKYIDMVIQNALTRGEFPEQLTQLTTAKNTLLLALKVKEQGVEATRDSRILLQVLSTVKNEMSRRKDLEPHKRAQEEKKPCNVYNNLLETLPDEIVKNAPEPLKKGGIFNSSARYPENLRAIVKLVQVVLKDGGVVAAIAAQGGF